jgi:hypothetical protein
MDLNSITLNNALEGHPHLADQVNSRAAVVAEEINLAAATAEWGFLKDDRGRDLLTLHIRDSLGAEARSELAPAELADERQLRDRLHALLDAALRVNRWRSEVKKLYGQISVWVPRYDPAALFHHETTTLNEQRSGPYAMDVMRIDSGGRSAVLEPIALWVVGADGRVDLSGVGGREIFVLDEGRGWFWVSNDQVERLRPMTEELFMQLLKAVIQ